MSTILVVDQDDVLRNELCETLTKHGYPVLAAADGEAALEQLRGASIQLLIADLHCAGIGGLDLLSRAREVNPAVPLVIMTVAENRSGAVDAMRAGAADYVLKPLLADEVLPRIARILNCLKLAAEVQILRVAAACAESQPQRPNMPLAEMKGLKEAVAVYVRDHIRRIIAEHKGDKRAAARDLGISLSSLYRHLDLKGPHTPAD